MHQKRRHVLISIFLLVPLIISVVGATDTLLCFGSDGHIAPELVEQCGRADHPASFSESERPDNCGPCIDVRFLDSTAYLGNIPHHAPSLIVFIFVAVAFILSCNKYARPFLIHHFPIPKNNISSLKTVVLLI